MNKEEFIEAHKLHQEWLADKSKGKRFEFHGLLKIDFDLDLDFKINLSRSDLSGCNLSGAILRRSNLSGSDLSGSDLSWANLSEANLIWANLSAADLRWADIDYSCWPLSCKTKEVKLCKKLQAQLLAHAFQVSPDCPMTQEQYDFIKTNFHRFNEFFTRKIEGEK